MHSYSRFLFLFILTVLGAVWGSQAGAQTQSGSSLVQGECAACHAVSASQLTEKGRMAQKGPALFYAGTKYRRDWVMKWLQDPVRIRPGGMFAGNHTIVTEEGDEIDAGSLVPHPRLDAKQAIDVADYLMTLTAHADVVRAQEYKPKKVSKRMGAMNFNKFKGCSSCHQDEPEYGGVSGPELYTAYSRLKADFIVAYIRNPLVWEGVSLMPHSDLKDKEIYKLVHYLKLISGEE
ncbi:cytochrome c [Paremcibacter congregatus]|nr:cytochrome c [Paremcibacter congregatus]QDE28893.1 c-type cytochrome [Paremcibacter congregatus]